MVCVMMHNYEQKQQHPTTPNQVKALKKRGVNDQISEFTHIELTYFI